MLRLLFLFIVFGLCSHVEGMNHVGKIPEVLLNNMSFTRTGSSFLELKTISASCPPIILRAIQQFPQTLVTAAQRSQEYDGAREILTEGGGASFDGSAVVLSCVFRLFLSLLAMAVTRGVEEKFHKENFRVLSEMRILAKIKVVILDLVGYVEILAKFGAKSDFRV